MKFTLLNLLFCFIGTLAIYSQQIQVSGTIFNDKNENQRRDAHEKGIGRIPVSNGDTIVFTNSKGQYSISASEGQSIFPIVPSKYHLSGRGVLNANFSYLTTTNTPKHTADFALCNQVVKKNFRIAAIGDVQVGNAEEITYANKSLFSELANRNDLSFNIFLGDLINDKCLMLSHLKNMIDQVPTPSWTVMGNHDRETKAIYQDSTYNTHFGASDFSFNYGNVHFVILNNIYSDGSRHYEGRLNARQMRFLKNDLALLPKEQTLVICQHIPLVFTKNKDEIVELLKDHQKVLFLSGHTHKTERYIINNNISEVVTGASCGNWWRGEIDWRGVPNSLMQFGSPRNYFEIEFNQNNYQLSFKGINQENNNQMGIWLSCEDAIQTPLKGLTEINGQEVFANIYAGCDSTQVRMKVDSGQWIKMSKQRITDPFVNRLINWNKSEGYPNQYSKKAALRRSPSPHIWLAYLPDDLKTGIHQLTIEAEDNFGYYFIQKRVFLIKPDDLQ